MIQYNRDLCYEICLSKEKVEDRIVRQDRLRMDK